MRAGYRKGSTSQKQTCNNSNGCCCSRRVCCDICFFFKYARSYQVQATTAAAAVVHTTAQQQQSVMYYNSSPVQSSTRTSTTKYSVPGRHAANCCVLLTSIHRPQHDTVPGAFVREESFFWWPCFHPRKNCSQRSSCVNNFLLFCIIVEKS